MHVWHAMLTPNQTDAMPSQRVCVATRHLGEPFRQWTTDEILASVTSKPLLYAPGTNWNYAHTNYVILGLALEKITGKKMQDVLQEKVLGPLGLTNTTDPGTPAIPEPALHAFTSERRSQLGIPAATPFYEESTYWNPSWTITHGAIQTSNIFDVAARRSASERASCCRRRRTRR